MSLSQANAPLSSYPVIFSKDAEFVRERLFSVFGADRFSIDTDAGRFLAHANHLQMSEMAVSYGSYGGAAVTIGFPEADYVRQVFAIEGTGRFSSARLSGEITRGYWTPVITHHAPLELHFAPGYRQLVLRIESAALQRYLEAIIGKPCSRKLEFDPEGCRGNPAVSNLRRRVFNFAYDFNIRGRFFSALAAAELERSLIVNFLLCHQHNYTGDLRSDPAPDRASTVRIAEEFIEANWDKPLDITKLAGVANVSARTLFRQFQKLRGYSPAEFAKRLRLQRASEMLMQPDAGTTVTQIALRCGFQNLGHFASDYRIAFGELPSETLQKTMPV